MEILFTHYEVNSFLVYRAVVSHTFIDCPVVIPKRVLSSLAVILCASSYTFPFVGNPHSVFGFHVLACRVLLLLLSYNCFYENDFKHVVLSKTRLLGGIACTTIAASGELMEKGCLG